MAWADKIIEDSPFSKAENSRMKDKDFVFIDYMKAKAAAVAKKIEFLCNDSGAFSKEEVDSLKYSLAYIDQLINEIQRIEIERDFCLETIRSWNSNREGLPPTSLNNLILKVVNGKPISDMIDWSSIPVYNEYVDGDGKYMDIVYRTDLNNVKITL